MRTSAAVVVAQAVGLDEFGSMSTRAHVFVGVVTLAVLVFIIRLVRRHSLRSKYSLLWLTVGLALAVVAAFPGLLDTASRAVGIYYPPATFLLMAVGFLFLIVVHFSWELSRSEERTRTLAEELALLRADHDELAARSAGSDRSAPPRRSDARTGPDDER